MLDGLPSLSSFQLFCEYNMRLTMVRSRKEWNFFQLHLYQALNFWEFLSFSKLLDFETHSEVAKNDYQINIFIPNHHSNWLLDLNNAIMFAKLAYETERYGF